MRAPYSGIDGERAQGSAPALHYQEKTMQPERWRQADQLFQAALERTPETRAAFVHAACGADDALRREVEALLAADAEAGSLMETPAYAMAAPLLLNHNTPSLSGRSVGHYEI
jgi:hypothetical protein